MSALLLHEETFISRGRKISQETCFLEIPITYPKKAENEEYLSTMVSLNVTLLMDELKLPLKLNDALLVLFRELRWLLLAVDMLSYAKPS